jgi:hypothetical protein
LEVQSGDEAREYSREDVAAERSNARVRRGSCRRRELELELRCSIGSRHTCARADEFLEWLDEEVSELAAARTATLRAVRGDMSR